MIAQTSSSLRLALHHFLCASLAGFVCVVACTSPDSDPAGRSPATTGAPPSAPSVAMDETQLFLLCGTCHALPPADVLPKSRWPYVVQYMNRVIIEYELGPPGRPLTPTEEQAVIDHYVAHAPEALPDLRPVATTSPLRFEGAFFGDASDPSRDGTPFIANVTTADLDRNGTTDVVICDARGGRVTWTRSEDGFSERTLADLEAPGRAAVVDADGDGDLDIAVAVLGATEPTDEPVGSAVLLRNGGDQRFTVETLHSGVGRVADLRPGDFDGDGDVDFVMAVFGGWTTGHLSWLENTGTGYEERRLYDKNGTIDAIPTDLDGDGDLDIVALVSQGHEEIVAFVNQGGDGPDPAFAPHLLWAAPHPIWGSAGMELVDLDQDGDTDILFTNGDALDIDAAPKPYHGVQWLENLGAPDGLTYAYHDLLRLYGAYRATAVDLDGDDDLDVVVTSLYNKWDEQGRYSLGWLRHTEPGTFAFHPIAVQPSHLVTAIAEDLDGDGRPDILAGGMHIVPPYDRLGRLTVWWNRGVR